MADLLEAILLPSEVAIVKCAAHTNGSAPVSRGNALADSAAKQAEIHASTLQLPNGLKFQNFGVSQSSK